MTLADEYKRQYAWRDWPSVFRALPTLERQTIFDLGCGVGDLAAALVVRGARAIGFDLNEELLHEARSRQLQGTEFRAADLRSFAAPVESADGLWCSFTAAYFPDFTTVLAHWAKSLKRGGWIALTEIDDLFGHEPLSEQTKELLSAYADDACAAGRYDFRMGRKLKDYLERCGFKVANLLELQDHELSFTGPARPDVLDSWRARLDRMRLLHDFCGSHINRVRDEFVGCLTRPNHESTAKVICCIASKT
jgi:ubiquinone/menaquinone biosynthesis C-methylase UbiE